MHSVQKFFTGLLIMLFLMPSFAGAATFGVTDTGSASYPGMVSYNSGATQNDQVLNFALDADDNIYTIGTQATNISDWLMQKYDANGELDADWGTAGSIAYVGTGFDLGNDIAVDGNGNIYAAGGIQSNGFDVAVRKYDVDGALDTAWGSSGMVTHDSEPGNDNTDIAKAIAVDSSVNIYVATQVNSDIAVFKYDADGVLDAAWGDMGSTTPYDSGGTDDVFSIALDGDGNVYVAGSQGTDIVVLKFGADGVLDGDWGIAGVFVYDSGEGNDVATEIITDSDGSVYVAGYQATATTGIDAVVLKLDDAGEFDATWGIAGIVSYNSNGTQTDQALDIVLDGGGNVYTVGYQATNGNDWLIQKYLSTGALDTDFGTSGIVTYNSGALQADVANTVAIDSNGFVVVGGYHTTNGRDVAIRRYTSWGALDVSFGNTSITDFPQNYVLGSLATLDEDATSIDSVSIYADAAIGTTTFAIYDDSFNLLWESDEIIDGTTDDWLTVSIASGTPSTLTDLDAGDYYLAFQIDNTAAVPNFSRGDGYVGFSLEQAYGAFADPLEDYIDTNMLWSVYATYTATPEPEVEEEEEESSGGSSSSHRRSSSSSSSSDTTPAAPASPVAFVASGSVEELMTQLLVLLQQLLEQLIAEQQNQ